MYKKVYLAGGMEFAKDGRSWRREAVSLLNKERIDTWEPYEEEAKMFNGKESPIDTIKSLDKEIDYLRLHKIMRTIVKTDLTVVSQEVDAILVKYDHSVLTGAGTHAEISVATLNDLPVHAWLEGLTLQEIPTWAIGCFDTISYSLRDAIKKVKESLHGPAK